MCISHIKKTHTCVRACSDTLLVAILLKVFSRSYFILILKANKREHAKRQKHPPTHLKESCGLFFCVWGQGSFIAT